MGQSDSQNQTSFLRIVLLVGGFLAFIPLTMLFGIFGFLFCCLFIVLAAFAK